MKRCVHRAIALTLLACGPLVQATALTGLPPGSPTASAEAPVVLPAARQMDLQASSNGHRYRIFLSMPQVPPPPTGYPVLYVLDGNATFPVAAFLARGFASRREVTGQPQVLVVGIGYPVADDFDMSARQRDYTPTPSPPGDNATGSAGHFLDFIEQQLKPFVATQHAVDPARQALFGHSFGGLFVLHAMTTRPTAFSTYLASSPSLWWDGQRVLTQLADLPRLAGTAQPQVQISVGALEDDPPSSPVPEDVRALLAKRKMIPPARALAGQLRAMPDWRARVSYHEFAGEDHGPVWLPAMSRGIQFFLEQP